jgi:endo-1,4-beta-D-glucanase Y
MYMVASEKVASNVAHEVTQGYMAWLALSFNRVSLFILIIKWTPKFVKLEMYDLQSAYISF